MHRGDRAVINLVVTAAAACPPNAKRDGEHQVIMLADACAVLCATGRADGSLKRCKLIAQRRRLGKLGGKAELATTEQRVEPAHQDAFEDMPAPSGAKPFRKGTAQVA